MGGELSGVEETVQVTHIWVNDLLQRTGWYDRQRAYRLLRATLHALRDHLPVNEAADLGAQLPILIRGVYYEGWQPARTPVKERSKEGFIYQVQDAAKLDLADDPERAVRAVLGLLCEKVTEGEMTDVRRCLPKHIRGLFPD